MKDRTRGAVCAVAITFSGCAYGGLLRWRVLRQLNPKMAQPSMSLWISRDDIDLQFPNNDQSKVSRIVRRFNLALILALSAETVHVHSPQNDIVEHDRLRRDTADLPGEHVELTQQPFEPIAHSA